MNFKKISVFALTATIAMSQMSLFTYALGISKSGTIDTMSSSPYGSMFIDESGSVCVWGNLDALNIPVEADWYKTISQASFSGGTTYSIPHRLAPVLYGKDFTKAAFLCSNYQDGYTLLLDKNKALHCITDSTGVSKTIENVEDFVLDNYILYTNGKVAKYSLAYEYGANQTYRYNLKLEPYEIDNVRDIAGGSEWAMFLKNDNSLWVCGSNEYGQLGTNGVGDTIVYGERPISDDNPFKLEKYIDRYDQTKPVKIMDDVASIEASGHNGYAIKLDGSLWSWGAAGGTGINSDEIQKKPVKVMENVVAVSACVNVAALTEDANLWVWGDNTDGQLGDGTTTRRKTPQKYLDKNGVLERNVIGVSSGGGIIMVSTGDAIYASGMGANGDARFESWATPTRISKVEYNTGKSCYNVLPIESVPKNQNIIVGANTYPVSLFNVKSSSFIKVRDLAKILSDNSNMGVKATTYSIEFINSKTSPQEADAISNITLLENKSYQLYGSWTKFSSDDLKLGEDLKIKAETYVVDGNTYVKMKDVMEYLGFTTSWDSSTKSIAINTKN